MSGPQTDVIIAALTRSGLRRGQIGIAGSDEALLQRLDPQLDSYGIGMLAATSKLLRLMHALLNGAESGEGFVEKFSSLWGSLKATYSRDLESESGKLDQFYGDIQLFCPSARDRDEEPLLFGLDRLRTLTEPVYAELSQWWRDRLAVGR